MDIQQIKALKGILPDIRERRLASDLLLEYKALQHYFSLYHFDCLEGLYESFEIGTTKSDDYKISCMRWKRAQAKAEVIVVHGLFDHVGLYVPLIKFLLEQKLNVTAFDLPEHGLSSGNYGGVSSFEPYARAFAAVRKEFDLGADRPLYALGQSTGAAVIMNYLLQCQLLGREEPGISKLLFLAPLLRVKGWNRIRLAYHLLRLFIKQVPREFTTNSHDPAFCAFLKNEDPFQPSTISVAWVKAMLQWSSRFQALEQCYLPGVVVQGSQDNTVNAFYNLAQIRAKMPNLVLQEVQGAYHHLACEASPWFEQVLDALAAAINESEQD